MKYLRKFPSVAPLAAVLSSLLIAERISATPLDFDFDGKSDRTAVAIEGDGSLTWTAQGDALNSSLGSHGRLGDNLIPGPWITAGVPVVGYLRSTNGTVHWNIANGDTLMSMPFGEDRDTQISGGDFNSDGVLDGAFVRTTGRRLVWSINSGLFSGGVTRTLAFGRKGDVPFFANPGTSHDWLAVLVRPSAGSLKIELRNPVTGNRKRISGIGRSLTNFARPIPLRRADGRDNFLFVRKTAGRTTAVVLGPTGKQRARLSVPESVDVVVGEFLSDQGEEFAFASSAGFVVYNPTTRTRTTIAAPSGVAVDEVNITTFATTDNSGLPAPRDTCYVTDPTDGFKTGFIWKPESDTQFGAVVILPGIYKNKVRQVRTTTTAGATIRTLAFKGNANPDPGGMERPHYIDRSMQGGEYRRTYRSIIVEAELTNGACLSYEIDNPANRVD